MTPAIDAPIAIVNASTRTRSESRAFWGVMLSFLVHGLVVSTWVSRVASIKTTLRLDDGIFGLTLLGTAIGSVLAIPICGAFVARHGSRAAAGLTGAFFCVALVAPAVAHNAFTLFLALFIFGAMAGANDVAMNAHAVGTEKFLGTPTISRFHSMFSLGGIAGAAIGGFIASRHVSPLVHLTCAAVLILGISAVSSRLLPDLHTGSKASGRVRLRRVPPALLILSIIGFCIFLSEGAIADWTSIYMKQVLRTGEGLAPMAYAVFSAAMAIFRFAGDAITLRLGRGMTIRAGGWTAAIGIGLAVFAPTTAIALVGFAAAGAGFSSIIPLVFAAGGRVAGVNEGAGVATVSGIGYLGFLAGPPAIGFISQMTSLRAGLFLLVVLSATAAALVTMVERVSSGASNPLSD